ncbi:histidine phosphatase family protein [Paenibacillus radicis (ex Xue et al. 2023)]|uniref:Histidine phosphatase family protein n=1 Tax=Paenibacillus radicis (ex Xue et al. 2023) TaxID=2972489 RepID=A0ABT1YEN8_9BACL|nr:histidine phosphatase family protein [Paenibacillus radicis (ex Xue et al. 2023)]MCR8630688.1 histidine phosphatase family protein [Paenibacillus radicis (ex Xue et al. 2023)]
MTLYYLVRHGEPDWSLKDRRQLSSQRRDFVPLTERGIKQAEGLLSKEVELQTCELILSSPYTRSLQTAAVMNRTLGLPLQVEFDLHEWTPDNWQAQTVDEITDLWNDFMLHDGKYPVGETRLWETREDLLLRTKEVLSRYKEYSQIIVVCYGMVIASLLGTHSEEIDYCGIYKYEG